ncbi:hypothetical protein SAMN05421734_10566 [Pelagirhabdus alkalitolerans]|uniref:Uncharacterized protein n=1 Tax=Pelagirhabdus alkalitolerans TaxID=1612202 RepID=A0A1G6JKQ1_9BACI|nr:hypothetical protein SAMN05421734_10566 [Pelagirhabdus alkalitolerans]
MKRVFTVFLTDVRHPFLINVKKFEFTVEFLFFLMHNNTQDQKRILFISL